MRYKAMRIFEHFINCRKHREALELRLARHALELEELKRELAKMSTEISRLKSSQNKKEEETHGREQDPAH